MADAGGGSSLPGGPGAGGEEAPDCGAALEELYSFLDGEMTDGRCAEVRHHLEACLPCFEAYDFEAELRQVVSRCCGSEQVPNDLRARIARAIGDLSEPE